MSCLQRPKKDLRDIIRYTRRRWGEAQTRSHVARLSDGIEAIAAGRGRFKNMAELHPGLRMAKCDHHYIFCLPQGDSSALIVAVLHERMDLMTRLADRLK